MTEVDPRFGGVARLCGENGLRRLGESSVCVIGVGGVGCWAAEALARSGVGAITLVDLDDVCVTNTNRQLHAVEGAHGRPKVDVMRERLLTIAPGGRVEAVRQFVTGENAARVLGGEFDCVIDAIDSVTNKCAIILTCLERGLPLVVAGAAGGRLDPTLVRVDDLDTLAGVMKGIEKVKGVISVERVRG